MSKKAKKLKQADFRIHVGLEKFMELSAKANVAIHELIESDGENYLFAALHHRSAVRQARRYATAEEIARLDMLFERMIPYLDQAFDTAFGLQDLQETKPLTGKLQ